ncbi:hypothetical protein C0Q70_18711 [Pomacea canaliculata]|uniref:RNA-binding protein NOB1 n=1 Tax=Pomacea canaliculata TaxID=400727 RepID=A0A2T7NHC6_POMCA|nr:hypothetical protein C0Q70_18711 [Pomacea canaliculata]
MAAPSATHVIVDAGGFIKNAPIWEIGENVYTVPEVVHESCDKATRQRLKVIPFHLNFKQPSSEAIAIVSDFAKKTGDYQSLSATDIKVIALTYMLEKEHVGTDHIKKEPMRRVNISDLNHYFLPTPPKSSENTTGEECTNCKGKDSLSIENASEAKNLLGDTDGLEIQSVLEEENPDSGKREGQISPNRLEQEPYSEVEKDSCSIPQNSSQITEQMAVDADENLETEDLEDDSDDDEGDGGWITPSNIKDVKRQMGDNVTREMTRVQVACLTTDFAIQNVLIQMGLNVISVDGMLIKSARNYVLRCFACRNMTKVFCPMCGNKTLKRVAMQRNEDGSVQIFISKRPISTRGMKFSLPAPKGGKHANNPLLFEDQPMPQQRASKQSKANMNVFDLDYVAGSSPFAVNDVTSRASHFGIHSKHDVSAGAYFNKRNPNEGRKRQGRRK